MKKAVLLTVSMFSMLLIILQFNPLSAQTLDSNRISETENLYAFTSDYQGPHYPTLNLSVEKECEHIIYTGPRYPFNVLAKFSIDESEIKREELYNELVMLPYEHFNFPVIDISLEEPLEETSVQHLIQ